MRAAEFFDYLLCNVATAGTIDKKVRDFYEVLRRALVRQSSPLLAADEPDGLFFLNSLDQFVTVTGLTPIAETYVVEVSWGVRVKKAGRNWPRCPKGTLMWQELLDINVVCDALYETDVDVSLGDHKGFAELRVKRRLSENWRGTNAAVSKGQLRVRRVGWMLTGDLVLKSPEATIADAVEIIRAEAIARIIGDPETASAEAMANIL
jgi:hypothetical protein